MGYGILGGVFWALDTVLLSIALAMSPFMSTAEAVFFALVEGTAAPCAILRLNTPECCAAVAIRTPCGASANVVPIHAHKPLPVRIVAEIVHALTKDRCQRG